MSLVKEHVKDRIELAHNQSAPANENITSDASSQVASHIVLMKFFRLLAGLALSRESEARHVLCLSCK